MKRGSYYVVEVEHFIGNFRHKAICYYEGLRYEKRYGLLFTKGYEVPRSVCIDDLYYFNVVSEITDMN